MDMRKTGDRRRTAAVMLGVVVVSTSMLSGPLRAQEIDDPLEGVNRAIFRFNRTVDAVVLRPLSIAYGAVVPELGRKGIRNLLNHIRLPVVFANDLLQGDRERAGRTLGRFVTNTILGFGVFDVAAEAGYPLENEDFGQTLGVWGAGHGPYLMLPLLGPSSLRDAGGLAVDSLVFDPLGYGGAEVFGSVPLAWQIGRYSLDAIDTRYRYGATLDDLYANSLDPYATIRTVYAQRRAAEVSNGEVPSENYDAIFDEPAE